MKILRSFDISELYTGMIVASPQNNEHLYELMLDESNILGNQIIKYRSVARIIDGEIKMQEEDRCWHKTIFTGWVETEESRKINPQTKREDRLKELGI